jgi:monoterpene epsilon-lactone hydrolase
MSVTMGATRGLLAARQYLNGRRAAARMSAGLGVRDGFRRGTAEDDELAALRARSYPEPAPVPRSLQNRYEVSRSTVAGNPVITLTPHRRRSGRHLIYTHGGGYVWPLVSAHWMLLDRATRDTGVTITVPLYRLAPESGVDAAYSMLTAVYSGLAEQAGGSNITLAGDSAGGGLAPGQAITYRDQGLPAPRQVILFSPWVDVAMTHPALPCLETVDPMLRTRRLVVAGELWAGDVDVRDPRISPLQADLHDLPPVHVYQGGRDILAADAQVLAYRLRAAGNTGTFQLAHAGFHVYVGAVWTPESRTALAQVREFLRR